MCIRDRYAIVMTLAASKKSEIEFEKLIIDVITNKKEQGWESLNKFIQIHQPKLSLFGDVHQPKATKWILGKTICMNVGYFRANSHYLELSSIDI